MKKILLILLLLAGSLQAQISPFSFWNSGQYALDFDGSTEYLSCTPALRLTGEYSLWDNFSDGNYDGWTVSSGAYSVVDSTPLSGGTKALKCTTAGIISIPCNQAYGSWEFDIYKVGITSFVAFINSSISNVSTGDNYNLRFRNDKPITLLRKDVAAIQGSATNYYSMNTWYRVKITRNTNGSFTTYIKGGAFGSDYILVSVTGGTGTNPATDNTYTSSNFFVLDLGASDMIANIVCQQGEGSLDLNSYERIYHADNRNMTKTGGWSWNGNGTHSIDTTSTDKRTGTYSSKIISTGAGDSTTNFVNLPNANFDTLKTDGNGVYEKYTLEFWVKSKGASGLPRVNIRIGNQLKTSDTISNIAFEKVVFNFQSNSLVSNQDIKLWINQADTVFVDDVSLTKSYDINIGALAYPTSTSYKAILGNSQGTLVGYDMGTQTGYILRTEFISNSTNLISIDASGTQINTAYSLYNSIANRTDSTSTYRNGVVAVKKLMTAIGSIINVGNLNVGARSAGDSKFQGTIGHVQITKFTDISQSNVNSTTLTTAYNRGKLIQNEWTGGSPIEVAFYDWKGATANEMLTDKSGTGNNLTGTNIDLTDRVKTKFK